jgi:hypothetical protein
MPVFGSSSIPNNLVVAGVNYATGPTGPTGPRGITGYSATGPTGATGIQFVSALIQNYTLGITYQGNTYFSLGVTAPKGSSYRDPQPNFTITFTGSSDSDAVSIFKQISSTDPYSLQFKTIKLVGEVTGGISLDSFYLATSGTTNAGVGKTGSLLYITDSSGSGQKIDATNDSNTNYYRSKITPVAGSLFGLTLDTFKFKVSQDYTPQFDTDDLVNINLINTNTNNNILNLLNQIGSSYSLVQGVSGIFNRTDQGVFITVKDTRNNNIYPKLSFRAEGITINDVFSVTGGTGAVEINVIGKGITYSTQTYKNSIIGSCCYCSSGQTSIVHRSCIDYCSQDFCDSISGNFSFKSCNNRYLTGDCYSGGACCVNGVCLETDKQTCDKVFGKYYENVKCGEFEEGCPSNCSLTDASCCVNGNCYSLPDNPASQDLCNELKGKYQAVPCDDRNCCIDGLLGACCMGADECVDESTPKQCSDEGGVFQGPGSICSSSQCCKDSQNDINFRLAAVATDAGASIPAGLKIGDYFQGGIVAGFVGYPPPIGFNTDGYFAKGEVISEIENYTTATIKRYVPVNGVYNGSIKCNCSNFSPSRYVDLSALSNSNGKVYVSDVKSLSGVVDKVNLTFYNRLTDACLTDSGKACNDNGSDYKKYGFNPALAYKQYASQVYGSEIPSAWILIVAPEEFTTNNISFGMSMSVNGFSTPDGFENYSNSLWQNNVLAPYGTTVFDGLLNTRLFDETSIERNTWFIANNYTLNGKLETIDPLAYQRFNHSKYSYWQSNIDQNQIGRNAEYFKSKYMEMWYAINNTNTALYQISTKNKESYNGYSDWYIPSALELNIMYYNMDSINTGLINNATAGWATISNSSKYWSSTTGGRLLDSKTLQTGEYGTKTYDPQNNTLEGIVTIGDPLIDTWRKYKLAQAHRAYTQDFSTGKMVSSLKSSSTAKLRACRMVPIYFKNKDFKNQFEYSFKSLYTCSSCR